MALHSVLSYFGSRHPPWDEVIIDRQWHTFTIAVWAIIEDPAETEDSRAIAIARWARDNMPVRWRAPVQRPGQKLTKFPHRTRFLIIHGGTVDGTGIPRHLGRSSVWTRKMGRSSSLGKG